MFWCEHIYVAFSTIYVGYLTLRRKSAYLRRRKISCSMSGMIPIQLQPMFERHVVTSVDRRCFYFRF